MVIININNINLSRFNVLHFTNWVLFFSLPILQVNFFNIKHTNGTYIKMPVI